MQALVVRALLLLRPPFRSLAAGPRRKLGPHQFVTPNFTVERTRFARRSP